VRIRYCYERELAKDPKLTAKAVPKFTIAPDGSVASATLSQSTGNTSLDACILAVFRRSPRGRADLTARTRSARGAW
jgi:outer membrane biosynthesis protein TonB